MTITKRVGKNRNLTAAEVDDNFDTLQALADSKASQAAHDDLAATVAGLAAGTSLPVASAYVTAVKFDSYRDMGQRIVVAPLNFTVDAAGAAIGGETTLALVADGVNLPTFAAPFAAWPGAIGYDNTLNRINEISFFKSAGGYYYAITPTGTYSMAPGAATLAAGASGSTTQALTITPPVSGGAPTTYAVFYKRAIDPTYSAGPVGATLTPSVTGLTPSTSYHFKVVASNGAGAGPDSNVVTVSTAAADLTAPTLVSATVANATPSRIDLVWSEPMNATVSADTALAISAGHPLTAHTYIDSTHSYLTTSTPFVNGEAARTLAYTQPGANKMQDLAGNLLANIAAAPITNNVAATSYLRFTTFEGGVTVESGAGPYTYTCNTAVNAAIAGANLKMPASVASSFVMKVLASQGADTYMGVYIDTDNTTYRESYVGPGSVVAGAQAAGTSTWSGIIGGAITGSGVVVANSYVRISRAADNTITVAVSVDNQATWTTIASGAGAAVDYFVKVGLSINPTAPMTVQMLSQTGMV